MTGARALCLRCFVLVFMRLPRYSVDQGLGERKHGCPCKFWPVFQLHKIGRRAVGRVYRAHGMCSVIGREPPTAYTKYIDQTAYSGYAASVFDSQQHWLQPTPGTGVWILNPCSIIWNVLLPRPSLKLKKPSSHVQYTCPVTAYCTFLYCTYPHSADGYRPVIGGLHTIEKISLNSTLPLLLKTACNWESEIATVVVHGRELQQIPLGATRK